MILLVSCAEKKAPRQIHVEVPAAFSGDVRITPCMKRAPADNLHADDFGLAETSMCPQRGDEVEMLVSRAGRVTRIAPADIHVNRTGDGIAVSITGHVVN
jgi:hypothetical protein